MKKFILFYLLSIFPFQAQAQSVHMEMNLGESSITTQQEVSLYNFSDELLSATENCMPYEEDFTINNPAMKELGALFGGADIKIQVNIEGLENEICRFKISYTLNNAPLSNYVCAINNEDRTELLKAMKDRSTEPVTLTYTSYATSIDAEGNEEKIPFEQTATGGLFDVTFAKITASACTFNEEKPSEDEQNAMAEQIMAFSEDFQQKLTSCQPATESKTFFIITNTIEVLGSQEDKCHLKFSDFDLTVPLDRLAEIKSFNHITDLLKDKSISHYTPHYETDGIFDGLNKCLHSEQTEQSGKSTTSFDNVSITKSLSFTKNQQECDITFLNELSIDNNLEDYSLTCSLSLGLIEKLSASYQNYVAENRDNADFNENLHKIEEKLLPALQEKDLCHPANKRLE